MEEDIEILEEFKTKGYSMLLMKYGDRNTANLKLERAIENLIKGYRELEKLKEKHNVRINDLCALVDNFAYHSVSKSKVKEKIEENAFEVYTRECGNIEVVCTDSLYELMEDK